MSQDKIDHPQDPKAASRRSRKDQQGRDYVCGCGKRYLSYPALYTHIKTKHHGQQPQGTQKTGIPPINRRPKSNLNDKILRQIQTLVQLQNLNILTHLDQNAHGTIPLNNRIRKQFLPKQFIQTYNSILKSIGPVILDKKTNLQTILICYLIGVGQSCSDTLFYQYYCPFAKYFRICFREYLLEVYDNCFKLNDIKKDRVISIEECYMAPIMCDMFLRFYLHYQKKQPEFITVMQLISYDFCNWMYQQKLTIVQITLNKKCQLRRNLIEPKKQQPKKAENQIQIQNQNDHEHQNQHEHDKQSNSENDNDMEKQIDYQKLQNQKESHQHHSCMNQSESQKDQQRNQQQDYRQVKASINNINQNQM